MSGFRRRVLSFVSPFFFSGGGGGGVGEGTVTRKLPFSTQVHSDWLTNFGKTPVTLKVFGVFNNNLKLIYL